MLSNFCKQAKDKKTPAQDRQLSEQQPHGLQVSRSSLSSPLSSPHPSMHGTTRGARARLFRAGTKIKNFESCLYCVILYTSYSSANENRSQLAPAGSVLTLLQQNLNISQLREGQEEGHLGF